MQMSVHIHKDISKLAFAVSLFYCTPSPLGCYSPRALGNRRVTETSSSSTVSGHPSLSQIFFWIDNQGEEGRGARFPKMHMLLVFLCAELNQPVALKVGCKETELAQQFQASGGWFFVIQ